MKLKVLVACEESQRVCIEFRKLGHEAYSCDILDNSGGFDEWHIKNDAIVEAYSGNYDLMIAFPPCTYLSRASAGSLFLKPGVLDLERMQKVELAKEFFIKLLHAPVKFKCLENPVQFKFLNMPKFTQSFQPYEFGDVYSKKTLLWLINLPFLKKKYVKYNKHYLTNIDTGKLKKMNIALFDTIDKKNRSKTSLFVAKEMALQWSEYCVNNIDKVNFINNISLKVNNNIQTSLNF